MRPPIIISGGGIIGSYISSRLSRHNIKNYVVEKRPQLLEKSNKIRTLTLNKNSIELLEKEGKSTDESMDFDKVLGINV